MLQRVPWGPGEAIIVFLLQFLFLNALVALIIGGLAENLRVLTGGLLAEGLAGVLVVVWVRLRFGGGFRMLGLSMDRLGENISRGLGYGFVSWAVSVPVVGYLTQRIADLFTRGPVTQPDQIQLHAPASIELFVFGFIAIVMAPIAEELLYRGFVHQGMRRSLAPWLGAIASGSIFMLAHAPLWLIFPSILTFGIFQARLFERRASLASTITAHMLFNAIGYLTYLSTP